MNNKQEKTRWKNIFIGVFLLSFFLFIVFYAGMLYQYVRENREDTISNECNELCKERKSAEIELEKEFSFLKESCEKMGGRYYLWGIDSSKEDKITWRTEFRYGIRCNDVLQKNGFRVDYKVSFEDKWVKRYEYKQY